MQVRQIYGRMTGELHDRYVTSSARLEAIEHKPESFSSTEIEEAFRRHWYLESEVASTLEIPQVMWGSFCIDTATGLVYGYDG